MAIGYCYACDGSGEGYRQGTTCLKCGGLGTINEEEDYEGEEDEYDDEA